MAEGQPSGVASSFEEDCCKLVFQNDKARRAVSASVKNVDVQSFMPS